MPFTLTMPKLSPTMEIGTIVKWHKKIGEHIKSGEVILDIATDKATLEFEMIDSGWLREILVPEGKEGIVNAPLAIFTEEQEESIEGYSPEGTVPPPSAAAPPKSAPSTVAGTEIPQALPLKPQGKIEAQAPTIFLEAEQTNGKRILASPLAKRLAQEQDLDLSTIKGSGPNGRIMKRDLSQAPRQASELAKTKPQIPAGTQEEVELTPIRKIIAKRLQEAKSTIPHFYVRQTINADALIRTREQLKVFEISVTFNDLIIKAVARALREHPEVNSGFNAEKNCLIRYKTVDICVAVSIEEGLITPIVTHADLKSVLEISAEVKELAKRAKAGKLQPHEYQGGSFTISNMGMYGISDFQAIINPPQAAILAVSGITDAPIVKNGEIVPGKLLNITLSADHRVVDGAAAALFIKTVHQLLENPIILFT